ncbi:type II secretion system protein [Candidatus Nomurabacteria bacterium]|nr:type II secretion system protein [Candidatus Nomurabacteria bacterium]
MRFGKNKKGFTLIELLVVVAIIGLLASVVLTSLSSARAKGRDARRLEDINQIRTALEIYAVTYSSYPASYANTFYWISDNNYPDTSGFPPCGTTGGLQGYLASVCSFKDPQGYPYAYIGNSDGSPKLGARFETSKYQTIPYTYGPNNTPVGNYFEKR